MAKLLANLLLLLLTSQRWPEHRTLQRHITENSKQIFPEKEFHGYSPNSYIHVSVSYLYIYLIGLPILLKDNTVGGPNVGINRSLTDT